MKKTLCVILLAVFVASFAVAAMAPSAEAKHTGNCETICYEKVWYTCCYYVYKGVYTKDCYWGLPCYL